MQEYASSPSSAWAAKDCAIYCVIALTVKGRTGERGATSTNTLVDIQDFYAQQVEGEG